METPIKGPIIDKGTLRFTFPKEMYEAFVRDPSVVFDLQAKPGIIRVNAALLHDAAALKSLGVLMDRGDVEVFIVPKAAMG